MAIVGACLLLAIVGDGVARAGLSPPANDDWANAQPMSSGIEPPSVDNLFATKEPGEPDHAGQIGGHSVWYRWTAPAAGTVDVSTCASGFDTLLAVYTGGSVGSLTTVAQNDDSCERQSEVSFVALPERTYWIAVDGYHGATGPIHVTLTAQAAPPPPPPPPAPACSDGRDNDGDGAIDFPADAGCASADDNNEANASTAPPFPPPHGAPITDSVKSPPTRGALKQTRRPPLTVFGGQLSGQSLRLRVTCSAPGRVELRSTSSHHRRSRPLAETSFRCHRHKSAPRLRLASAIRHRLRHHRRVSGVLAVSSRARHLRLRVVLVPRRKGSAGAHAATAADGTPSDVSSLCAASGDLLAGGVFEASVDSSARFGYASPGEIVYWRTYAHVYYPDGSYNWVANDSWDHYVVNEVQATTTLTGQPGNYVFTAGGGGAVYGTQHQGAHVPHGLWAAGGIDTWTAARGYVWHDDIPLFINRVQYSGGWCGF